MAGKSDVGYYILFAVIAVLLFVSSYLYTVNSNLRDDLSSLESSYNGLVAKYNDLNSKYGELVGKYNELVSKYNSLSSKYSNLENLYNNFVNAYHDIVHQIDVRAGDDPDSWSMFFDYNSPEVDQATSQALSKWLGNPYSKIYDWVKDNIKYNYDTPIPYLYEDPEKGLYWHRDYWKKASETIKDGYGDCEDQAILVASMVMNYWQREYGKQYTIWSVIVYGPGSGHVFTIIPVKGGKVIILDPAGSQITGWDIGIFRLVEAEDISRALNDYFEAWASYGITYTKVHAVFNSDTYQILDLTPGDFINWLYNQS